MTADDEPLFFRCDFEAFACPLRKGPAWLVRVLQIAPSDKIACRPPPPQVCVPSMLPPRFRPHLVPELPGDAASSVVECHDQQTQHPGFHLLGELDRIVGKEVDNVVVDVARSFARDLLPLECRRVRNDEFSIKGGSSSFEEYTMRHVSEGLP
jgi:hypothetical protein